MVSLKELAADLGVSHALVSRVLNNRMGTTRVSDKTRKAILARAKELNYNPNPVALALRNGRTGVIGVFHHGFGVPGSDLSEPFTRAAGKTLSTAGFKLWIEYFETREEFIRACGEELLGKVDGLLVSGLTHPELAGQLRHIHDKGLPVVTSWEGTSPPKAIPNFHVDTRLQTYLPSKHLLERGCRRIAHFSTEARRREGYCRALAEADLPIDPALCIDAPHFTVEQGRQSMERLLKSGVVFDGLCAQSDAQAAGALMALVSAGVPRSKWPKLTGVDNSPIASDYSLVPLTSTTAERPVCAELAVKALVTMSDGKRATGKILPPQLIIRDSTN